MRIAITGGTGFLGRYLIDHLANRGHTCVAWYRAGSNRDGFVVPAERLTWVPGELGDSAACGRIVANCDVVVHSALHHASTGRFQRSEGEILPFAQKNIIGTLELIEAARAANVPRFIFISTCAVHDQILSDRPLDEAHPLWPKSHYGAHKAAIEKFVHSYGFGLGYDICALRPTGIYGLAEPPEDTKWFDLVRDVVHGRDVQVDGGGKEVHALDVARAVEILLTADGIAGQAYSCYDRYISRYDVATAAKRMSGSSAHIHGTQCAPKNQIVTDKLRKLGMTFGGQELLEQTIKQMFAVIGR